MTAQPGSVTDNVAMKGVFVGGPSPGSYTHLDVYKRQGVNTVYAGKQFFGDGLSVRVRG